MIRTTRGMYTAADLAEHHIDHDTAPPSTAEGWEEIYVKAMAAADRHAKTAEKYRDYETWDIANLAAEDVERARDAYLNACEDDRECIEIGCRAESDNDLCTEHTEGGGDRD